MLEGTYEFFCFFFRWHVLWLVKRLDPKRGVVASQFLVDLVHHLVDDLQVPLGPATEVVVQHPVLFGKIKQLQSEAFVHLRQSIMLAQIVSDGHRMPRDARLSISSPPIARS